MFNPMIRFARIAIVLLSLGLGCAQAQSSATDTNDNNNAIKKGRTKQVLFLPAHAHSRNFFGVQPAAAAPQLPVTGVGTLGQLTKWTGFTSSSAAIGDSAISEDKFGNVGIGAISLTSKFTVAGMIQSTLGGFKFPDGSVQTTAGIGPNAVVRSLNALKGDVTLAPGPNITLTPSANTLTISATGLLSAVIHDTSLSGGGTSSLPLGIMVPLNLSGTSSSPIIQASNIGLGTGVQGFGSSGSGVRGTSDLADGVHGSSGNRYGVFGNSANNDGVRGESATHDGVSGSSANRYGVFGSSTNNDGVHGESETRNGVSGFSNHSNAVFGESEDGTGVVGQVLSGNGILGISDSGSGLVAQSNSGDAIVGFASAGHLAGSFVGDVTVGGNLIKASGSFRIDHPLDPENKYLYHSFVESPDMKNIYDGVAALDASGEAVVQMPEWFDALNKDFRYQLTCIGGFAPIYIASKLSNRQFKIAGGQPGMEVSWQVTGIRQDPWANNHRIKVEEEKTERERGYFLHPELFNQPEEKGIEWVRHPDLMNRMKQEREQLKQKQQ